MEGAQILALLALLAINVLGFSGIVAVLGRRAAGEWTPLDRLRFLGMVRFSAGVLLSALLPFPLYHAGVAEHELWGWCSAIGAVLGLVIPAVTLQGMRALGSAGVFSDPELSRSTLVYTILTLAGTPPLLALNALGIVFERTFTPYLVGTLLLFGGSVVFFLHLLRAATGRE